MKKKYVQPNVETYEMLLQNYLLESSVSVSNEDFNGGTIQAIEYAGGSDDDDEIDW